MKINRQKLVVTVEGEMYAGSLEVAKALAKLLRIRCLSSEILDEASRLSGISLKLLRRYEEKHVRHAYDLTASGEDELAIPPARDFLTAQIAACRALASEGPCVLVGHHSGTALSDADDAVSIFVHANRSSRLARYTGEKMLPPEKAARRFAREDRQRTRYFKAVNPGWGRASRYDLSVNTDTASPEVLAGHIVQYLETVTREKLVHPTLARRRSA